MKKWLWVVAIVAALVALFVAFQERKKRHRRDGMG